VTGRLVGPNRASGTLDLVSDVRAGPPFLPDRWRAGVTLVTVLGVVGVAACGWRYAGDRTAGRLDTTIDNWLIPLGENHYRPVAALAALGSPPVMVLAVIACLVAVWRTRRYWPAGVLTVVGPVLAAIIAEAVLKPLLGRTHYGDLSLPSGHATCITAVVTAFLVAFVAAGLPHRAWLRRLLVMFALLAVAGTALAVVALDRHYATDAVAGVLTGASISGLVALVLDAGMRALAFHPAEEPLPEPADDGAP